MDDLQNRLEDRKENWLKRAYREEWPIMPIHVIASATAIGAAAGFSCLADNFIDSEAMVSAGATAVDATSYWATFLPQLLYRDRNKLRNDEGSLDRRKMLKKAGECLSYIGIAEAVYILGRFIGQYVLQRQGWDPATASATVQGTLSAFLTVTWPPIRYLGKQVWEK